MKTKQKVHLGNIYSDYDLYQLLYGVGYTIESRCELLKAIFSGTSLNFPSTSLDLMSGRGETSKALSFLSKDSGIESVSLYDLDIRKYPNSFSGSTFLLQDVNHLKLENLIDGKFDVTWLLQNSISEMMYDQKDLITTIDALRGLFSYISKYTKVFVIELDYPFSNNELDVERLSKIKLPKKYIDLYAPGCTRRNSFECSISQYVYAESSDIIWDTEITTPTHSLTFDSIGVKYIPISILYPLLLDYFGTVNMYELYSDVEGTRIGSVDVNDVILTDPPTIFVCHS